MIPVWFVIVDLWKEAKTRKWLWALWGVITLCLLLLTFSLQTDVIDGALAGTKLFGKAIFGGEIHTAIGVLNRINMALAGVFFYVGALFLCLACADFAPKLLEPGRIEHLLSLPVRRWQLLVGTYLGVMSLAATSVLYASCGMAILFGIKMGIWNVHLVEGALLGLFSFSSIYAVMLLVAVFVRSAALSGGAGLITLILGIFASYRKGIGSALEAGWSRMSFELVLIPFPRIGSLAQAATNLAGEEHLNFSDLFRWCFGALLFSTAVLFLSVALFERKDY